MPRFASLNGHGVPVVISTRPADGMVEVPEGVDPLLDMCPSGKWEPRPAVEVRGVDRKIVMTNVPPGTHLEVVDVTIGAIIMEVTLEGDEMLDFAESGEYQIEVAPPMPWRGWSGRLSC